MTSHTVSSVAAVLPARSRSAVGAARYFSVAAALLIAVLTFIGFSHFYLRGMAYPNRPIAPSIKWLVIAHGISMTAWIVLLLVQPVLILRASRKLHMAVGKFGAALAAVILALGLMIGVRSAAVAPPGTKIWGLDPAPFMAVPFISALIFAGYVALGISWRRKPTAHRAMMFLATLAALSAAISRIDPLSNLYLGTVWERLFGPFFFTLVLGVILLAARCALTRSLDRWFAAGLAALIALDGAIMWIARTEMWNSFATSLMSGV